KVVPDLLPGAGAEPVLEGREQLRAANLVAAALAEDGADQRGDRDHVVPSPRRPRHAVRAAVGVDPGDVRVDVADELPALGARAAQELDLARERRLRRRARLHLAT